MTRQSGLPTQCCVAVGPAMIIPHALPDELFIGYRARLAIVNGVTSPNVLAAKLVAASGRDSTDIDPTCALIHVAAKAAQKSPMAFLDAHSNFRINCTPGKYLEANALESTLTPTQVLHVIAPSTIGLRVCRACIDEDLRAHGFSTWRRSHHVPGRYICPRHDVALLLIRRCGDITALPDAVIADGLHADKNLLRLARHNPSIGRYLEHMDRIVDGKLVIERGDVTASIRSALLKQGEPLYSRGWTSIFAARIARVFSFEWLQQALSPTCKSTDAIAMNFVRGLFYDYSHMSHPTFAVLASVAVDWVHRHDLQVVDDECLFV